MKKLLLCLVSLFFVIPALAGELENALKSSDKVVLYIYTNECGYCKLFEHNYTKMISRYSQCCKFVKVDGATAYGNYLVRKFHVDYVPYVVLINSNSSKNTVVSPSCLLDDFCIKQQFNSFLK